jgi:selenocysteine lyase/cysteine desulfurase
MSLAGPGAALTALRAQFPVLQTIAYLNAGTNGPLPTLAVAAARAELEREQALGRGSMPHFERRQALASELRAAYAERVGCVPADLAMTGSTTEGIARVLLALELHAGDEIVTSDEEHPGVLGPLVAQRARGVEVRIAPWADVADAVGPRTRLVVCSHVSWRSGRFAPLQALAQLDVPLLVDGAQGAGAVPVDVALLAAGAYAAAGQKWLCGPEGTGLLYVSEGLRERMRSPAPGYVNLLDPGEGLGAALHADARAYDAPVLPASSLAQAMAALAVLREAGWDAIHANAAALAAAAADALRERGRDVLPRDRTTLVTWREPDADTVLERLAAARVVVRTLPAGDLLRASFGGWSTSDDLDRLLAALPR